MEGQAKTLFCDRHASDVISQTEKQKQEIGKQEIGKQEIGKEEIKEGCLVRDSTNTKIYSLC